MVFVIDLEKGTRGKNDASNSRARRRESMEERSDDEHAREGFWASKRSWY